MVRQKSNCGAFWIKVTRGGDSYLSGMMEDKPVVIFRNKFKKSPHHPDYYAYYPDMIQKEKEAKAQRQDVLPTTEEEYDDNIS